MRKERDDKPQAHTLEDVTAIAKEVLLRDGRHAPTLIAEGNRHTVLAQVSELGHTHEERTEQMFAVGVALAQTGVIGELKQAFFISEAWMSKGREGKTPHLPPSQDPNRKEVLIVSRFQLDDEAVEVAILEMVRDEAGRITEARAIQPKTDAQQVTQSPLLTAFARGYDEGGVQSDTDWIQ